MNIVELYKSGLTITQVASQVNTTAYNVRKALEAEGVSIEKSGTVRLKEQRLAKMSESLRDKIVELYNSGISLAAVADKVHISAYKVKATLEAEGIPIRGKETLKTWYDSLPVALIDEIKDQYVNKNVSMKSLSTKFGFSSHKIAFLLDELGVRRRDRVAALILAHKEKESWYEDHTKRRADLRNELFDVLKDKFSKRSLIYLKCCPSYFLLELSEHI